MKDLKERMLEAIEQNAKAVYNLRDEAYVEGIDQAAEACAAVASNQWIGVEDELPEVVDADLGCVNVLALCGKHVYQLSYFPDSKKFYCDFPMKSYWEDWTEFVTHWQPNTPFPTI